MGFRKGKFKKKRQIGKRNGGWGQTLSTVGSVASKALSIAKFVAGIVNTEAKYFDTTVGSPLGPTTMSALTTGDMINLNLIAQGIAGNQRIGNSIKLKSLQFKMMVYQNLLSATPVNVRIMLIQDNINASYATPAVSDVLENNALFTVSPLTMQQRTRWEVLYDQHFVLAPSPVVVGGTYPGGPADQQAKQVEFFHSFKTENPEQKKNNHVLWDEAGNAQADLRQGSVYLVITHDQPTALNAPGYYFYNRIRYIDD